MPGWTLKTRTCGYSIPCQQVAPLAMISRATEKRTSMELIHEHVVGCFGGCVSRLPWTGEIGRSGSCMNEACSSTTGRSYQRPRY